MHSFSRKATDSAAQDASGTSDAAGALAALRGAIERHGRVGSDLEHLRMPVVEYCARARQENIEPQQMLVCLKNALDGLPFAADDTPTSREATRARIVGVAIEAYYADGRR